MRVLLFVICFLFSSLAHANTRSGLFIWYKFNEGTGTNAFDSSWVGNNGTLNSSPAWTSNCVHSACLKFNGSSSNMNVTTATGLFDSSNGAQPYTWSVWINNTAVASSDTVFSLYEPAGGANRAIPIRIESSKLEYWKAGAALCTSALTLLNNTWYNVTVVKSGSGANQVQIYINGVANGSACTDNSAFASTPASIGGDSDTGTTFFGYIDDVRVYNRALTAQEVQDLYNSGIQIKGNGTFIQGNGTKLNY